MQMSNEELPTLCNCWTAEGKVVRPSEEAVVPRHGHAEARYGYASEEHVSVSHALFVAPG